MSKLIAFVAIAFAIAGSSACSSSDTTPGTDPAASHHAPEGATPGSHQDWCGEHAVPESQCTRCNPALIPAFQASNDWCAEHALPESQCLACNPGLRIERPAPSATN